MGNGNGPFILQSYVIMIGQIVCMSYGVIWYQSFGSFHLALEGVGSK